MVDLSASETVNRMTLLRKHYEFQHGCFVSEFEEKAGGIFAFSSVTPIPMWNHSAWIDGSASDFRDFVENTKGWQQEKNRRPVIYIPDPAANHTDLLRSAGFEKFDEEAWMICNAREVSFSRDTDVQEVANGDMLQQFIDTFT